MLQSSCRTWRSYHVLPSIITPKDPPEITYHHFWIPLPTSHTADIKYATCHGCFSWLKNGHPHSFQQAQWFSDRDIPAMVTIQQSIGWDHFVRGWIAIEWGNIINHHPATKPHIHINAEDWGTKLLAINWKYILELWAVRNNKVKGTTPDEQNCFRTDTISEIQYLQIRNPFDQAQFINANREIRINDNQHTKSLICMTRSWSSVHTPVN
jgi:hypothetical protein